MLVKNVNNDIRHKYNPSILTFLSVSDFFTLLDPINCPVKKCEILAEGCQAPLGQRQVEVPLSNPSAISIKFNVKEGYHNVVCYKCLNSGD